MKRFFAWWRDRPRFYVQFVKPGNENPLARRAIESLQQANEGSRQANESLRQATETIKRALALVDDLQAQLDCARAELAAYAAGYMEADAQVAELERIGLKETPSKDV